MNAKITEITSAQNAKLKEIRKLKTTKSRKEQGRFLAEGLRLVREVKAPWRIETLVVSDRFYAQNGTGSCVGDEVLVVPETIFATLCDTESPQGILAVVPMIPQSIPDTANPFLVALENLQDPGNVGTIMRTADAAGADGILVSRGTADPYSPKVVRASMGAVFHLPIVETDDLISTLHAQHVRTFATHLGATKPHFQADFTGPCAVLIGNEANGLSDTLADAADERILILQPGQAESLNASVAAGIVIYEVVRQRTQS